MPDFVPRVSIIIPVYNGADYLKEAIDSAIAQDYPNLEIIVVNDGSCDDGHTARIACSYGKRILYLEKPNGGVATALNMGIKHMTGEYFSWLSHDDLYAPTKISSQVLLLENIKDKTTIISCGTRYINSTGKEKGRFHPCDFYNKKQLSKPLFPLFHGCISGCALLIHKSHFDREGLFNEELPYTQDYDLWFKMMRSTPVFFHPKFLSMTRVHAGQGSNPVNEQYTEACNNIWIYMMQTVTIQERCAICGSEYLFYRDVSRYLTKDPVYDKAARFAYKQAGEILQKLCESGRLSQNKKDRFQKSDEKIISLLIYDRMLKTAGRSKLKRLLITARAEGLHAAEMKMLRSFQSK